MIEYFTKENGLDIVLNTHQLTPAQIRLIKTLNSTLLHLLSSRQEEDFFKKSNELMRLSAQAIKQANYINSCGKENYADQAIEISVDNLIDNVHSKKVVHFDN